MQHRLPKVGALAALVLFIAGATPLRAETGYDGWQRYAPLDDAARLRYASLPAVVVVAGESPVLSSAQAEVLRGVRNMMGRTLRVTRTMPREPAIVLGTFSALHELAPALRLPNARPDSFLIARRRIRGLDCVVVAGSTERGVLYGAFGLLRRMARGQNLTPPAPVEQPYAPIRWIDQWDNLDGTIERGYAGPSIFFENRQVRGDLTRVADYGRLLASVGINGCNINNVNADLHMLDAGFLPHLARIADALRPWGVRMSISVDLSTPKTVGGLESFDPLDSRVAQWWAEKVAAIYRVVPDFGGFTVKADSEGRLGPSAYGRTPADAANMIARALQPHGGLVFYRAFVYNHHLDWRDMKADRAKAAVENFGPLDGKFEENVVIQIKNGPIDFQVREPVSPLFGQLKKTNQAIELQITEEYLGQQRHIVFIPSMWKEVLDFDLRADRSSTPVRDLVSGRTFHRPTGGFVGVANVGMDVNWLAHPLAMSNLYGFGRLAWNPTLSPAEIANEWTELTFGSHPAVLRTVNSILLTSWRTYESYSGVLGIGTLTDITGTHFGPGVESSERNGWGMWHRADRNGVGMDRTVATGTGYVAQYVPPVAHGYESLATTPDDLLLFFHHVPYTHVLHSGGTVIQHIYDAHYAGAKQAAQYVREWKRLRPYVDEERYRETLARLDYQAGHAIVWRDAVCKWFFRSSGIADSRGRVGHYPERVEAETMHLEGYTPFDLARQEDASGGKGVECRHACSASFKFERPAGWYQLDVQFFDMPGGKSRYRVFVNDQQVDAWTADDQLPAQQLGADSSTHRRIPGLALRPGDQVRIEGVADAADPAALDYVAIHRSPAMNTRAKTPR